MEGEYKVGFIAKYNGFNIKIDPNKESPGTDRKKLHYLEAWKNGCKFFTIILYEIDSTPSDLEYKDVEKRGLALMKQMIDREMNNIEIPLL